MKDRKLALKKTDMEQLNLNKLLLKTAFSCMACDGDIDKREVNLIKRLHKEKQTFGEIDINDELDNLLLSINKEGHQFLRNYFNELKSSELTEKDELKLIEVAIATIKADEKVEYSEIKFFKVIRSKLDIDNKAILESHPDFEEYLEQDIISESYLSKLQDDFFDTQNLPEFKLLENIDNSILKTLGNKNEQ
jgi:uncharacterized tellurite resistance protein B-like protein